MVKYICMKMYERYIEMISDLMAIETPKVIFHEKGRFYNQEGQKEKEFKLKPTAKASTVPDENTIYVDLDKFSDEIDLYLSLAHEIRHCAQYQALDDIGLADIASPEMLKIWRKELKGYKGSETSDYLNQHIEIDAFAFAWLIGKNIFGVEMTVNGTVDERLLAGYKQYISNNYSKEEIEECKYYWGFEYSNNQA